ncbi:hypothetical protein CASFOL_030253 [Castilleja foliolosa]|uniref:GDSL esterase/lipase n=1 Tax=Castilleja foliolosa TaxID=1961234 RepID=A0ABD3C815_9LAMI
MFLLYMYYFCILRKTREMVIGKWEVDRSFVIFLVIVFARHVHVDAVEMRLLDDLTMPPAGAMYVLGDSSVDCGDNTPFYILLHRNLSLFPCNGSDATLLPQLLAKKMGLPNTIPFYTQNGSIHSILGGVNFGSTEATILYPSSRSYQSLNQQLRQASEIIQLLQLHFGEEKATNFIKTSVFYLSFGKDDFIDYFVRNSSRIGRNFSHILAHQMTNAIRNLYANNVRKIVFAGVLPLGCAPRMLLRSVNSCLDDEVNMLVLEYNTMMEENVVAINAELSDARVIFCDVYRAMIEIINHPTVYGMEDVKNACCGVGKYGGESGCLSTDMACEKTSAHVWWDLYNPTPVINSMLAGSAWSGQPLSSICRPINVQELVSSSS